MDDLATFEKRALVALRRKEDEYVREIALTLKHALEKMQSEMTTIYRKYAKDGKLSYADMAQYNRYKGMQESIVSILDEATAATVPKIKELVPDQYNESFYRHAWAIDNSQGIRLAWGTINPDVVTELLASKYFKIALKTYGPDARKIVRRELADGLPRGKSYDEMVKGLKKALNIVNYKALRIIRTEGQAAINAGQDDAYMRAREMGVEGRFVWTSTLDRRTRPSSSKVYEDHRSMDGQVKGEDGTYNLQGEKPRFPLDNVLSAGQRINCRCRERFEPTGFSPVLRRTRDQGLIPMMNYDEWFSKLSDE